MHSENIVTSRDPACDHLGDTCEDQLGVAAERDAGGAVRDRHRAYACGRHTAQGRYPAATAVSASAKKTRCLTYPPRAIACRALRQSRRP